MAFTGVRFVSIFMKICCFRTNNEGLTRKLARKYYRNFVIKKQWQRLIIFCNKKKE